MSKTTSAVKRFSNEHAEKLPEPILSLVPPSSEVLPPSEEEYAQIAARAYQLWEQRGYTHGHDVKDWLEAEEAIRGN